MNFNVNLLRFTLKFIENPPKSMKIFFVSFFRLKKKDLEKNIFSEKNPYQLKISPGIQKSYLEHRATSLKIWVQSMPLRNEYGMSGLGAPPTILGLLGHPQTLRNWTTHGLHRFRVSNLNLLEIYSKNVRLTSWFGVSEAVQRK